jgi:hypothetical protein
MLSVSVCNAHELPIEAEVKFQLISVSDGSVLASGATDAQGVVSFDVDPANVGDVALRLDLNGEAPTTPTPTTPP